MNETLPKVYSVLSIDQEFWRFIKSYKYEQPLCTVHSVFNQVINFKAFKSQLYSIVQYQIGNGPYSMRMNSGTESFLDLNIKAGDLVILNNGCLTINNIKFSVNHPKIWVPIDFKISEEHLGVFLKNLEVFNKVLLSNHSSGGTYYYYVKRYFSFPPHDKASVVEKELCERILSFLWGIKYDQQHVKKYIKALIGFGYGLTPSGDDFLVGFLTALNKAKNKKVQSILSLMTNILKYLKISTTDISKTMIYASLEGKSHEKIHDFVNCLLSSMDEAQLKQSILNVFSIGSSSGMDLAIGIIEGIRFSLISE